MNHETKVTQWEAPTAPSAPTVPEHMKPSGAAVNAEYVGVAEPVMAFADSAVVQQPAQGPGVSSPSTVRFVSSSDVVLSLDYGKPGEGVSRARH